MFDELCVSVRQRRWNIEATALGEPDEGNGSIEVVPAIRQTERHRREIRDAAELVADGRASSIRRFQLKMSRKTAAHVGWFGVWSPTVTVNPDGA